jgi:hypothetical protein
MGAAVDREHGDALRRGELTEELPAPGFEAFSGARVPASRGLRLVRPDRSATEADGAARKRSLEQQAAAARNAEADRRRRLEADELARKAAAHARDVSELEAERSRVKAQLMELDQRLRTARRAARQAAAASKRARRNGEAT